MGRGVGGFLGWWQRLYPNSWLAEQIKAVDAFCESSTPCTSSLSHEYVITSSILRFFPFSVVHRLRRWPDYPDSLLSLCQHRLRLSCQLYHLRRWWLHRVRGGLLSERWRVRRQPPSGPHLPHWLLHLLWNSVHCLLPGYRLSLGTCRPTIITAGTTGNTRSPPPPPRNGGRRLV